MHHLILFSFYSVLQLTYLLVPHWVRSQFSYQFLSFCLSLHHLLIYLRLFHQFLIRINFNSFTPFFLLPISHFVIFSFLFCPTRQIILVFTYYLQLQIPTHIKCLIIFLCPIFSIVLSSSWSLSYPQPFLQLFLQPNVLLPYPQPYLQPSIQPDHQPYRLSYLLFKLPP